MQSPEEVAKALFDSAGGEALSPDERKTAVLRQAHVASAAFIIGSPSALSKHQVDQLVKTFDAAAAKRLEAEAIAAKRTASEALRASLVGAGAGQAGGGRPALGP